MDESKEKFNSLMLIIVIITLFMFIISFTAFYTKENFSAVCGCNLPIWVIVISIASFGFFVGSLLYYLLNKSLLKERKDLKKCSHKIFNLMESEEKKIIQFIIQNSGEVNQSQISKSLNLDKVRISRVINSLENKKIIHKKKNGMTNLIILDNDLNQFLKN